MRIGAHVETADPLGAAAARGAEVVQFFLTDPQSYAAPKPRPDADTLRAADVDIFVHSPYPLNVASTNNRIRVPGRKLLLQHAEAAAAIGAKGLIVHGGHVERGGTVEAGLEVGDQADLHAGRDLGCHRRRRRQGESEGK